MNYEEAAKELICLIPRIKKSHAERHVNMFSKGEAFMLACVAKNGGIIMPGEIAKTVGVSTARVAAFLNSAENKGYIKRQNMESDRRKVKVVLTEKGFEKVRNEQEKMLTKLSSLLKKLGEEDAENLIRILKKIQDIFYKEEIEI